MDATTHLTAMRQLHGSASLQQEAGQPCVYLPAFTFTVDGEGRTMDLLLYPQFHSGYPTRLFFSEQIGGKGQNWTEHPVIGRNWWAPSWNYVQAEMPWTGMLCAHLKAVT